MVVLFIIIIALLGAVIFLRGEGDSYGKGNAQRDEKKKISVSDKHFLL